MNKETIKTERLCLREITAADSDCIVEWRSDPEVYRYFKNPVKITKEQHLEWFNNSYLANASRLDFLAVTNDNNTPVGVFGLTFSADNPTEAEVSYILGREYRGMGYAAEALGALALWAKENRGVKTLAALIHQDNAASLAFAERLGFSEAEKDFPFIELKKEL